MNVLWITNIILPEVADTFNLPSTNIGGWMASMLHNIRKSSDFKFTVASTYKGKNLLRVSKGNVTYILLPGPRVNLKYNKALSLRWLTVVKEHEFDVIHIHGTEYTHGLALMKALPQENYVISIQGLVSICARYYYAGISLSDIIKNTTFRDMVKGGIIRNQISFKHRGKLENEYLLSSRHIIGRTKWDRTHCMKINPELVYHFCNETLRDSFYKSGIRNFDGVQRHSVFISQGSLPIKGLHMILKALPIIKRSYPDCMVYIAGRDITETESLKLRLKLSGYGKYIKRLIAKLNISNSVIFVGPLNEQQMAEKYAKSHVFVCPSSIENSPNSLGEAQIIGTPVVASYAGGIPDMAEHEKSALLYRFEEYEMLADSVVRIFGDDKLALRLSENGRIAALKRHDPTANAKALLNIYRKISN